MRACNRALPWVVVLATAWSGCKPDAPPPPEPDPCDLDDDGFEATSCGGEDCEDTEAGVHPGVAEVCGNGFDDDCDGLCPGCGLCGEVLLAEDATKIVGLGLPSYGGDLNDDGFDDVLLLSSGRVLKFHGPLPGLLSLGTADLVVEIPEDGPRIGPAGSAAVAGDFAGGDPQMVLGGLCDWSLLAVMVDASQTGTVSSGSGIASFPAPETVGVGQCPLTHGGDTDGDGQEELVLGIQESSTSYRVVLFEAPLAGELESADGVASLVMGRQSAVGRSLASGDFDGDGYDDIVVAEPSFHDSGSLDEDWEFADDQDGLVAVVYGPISGEVNLDWSADATITGRRCRRWSQTLVEYVDYGSSFGNSVAHGADLNDDGMDDLIIGAPSGCSLAEDAVHDQLPSGEVYVFFGPVLGDLGEWDADLVLAAEGWTRDAVTSKDAVGASVSAAGDVNGDGVADLVVGALNIKREGFAETNGGAYLIYGPLLPGILDLEDADAVLLGEGVYDASRAGATVRSAGDINADGFDDIMIGDPGDGEGGNLAGATYVLYGGPGF